MQLKRLMQRTLAAGVLVGLIHLLVLQFTDSGDRLYQFLYARGGVQHAIVVVACLVIALLFEQTNQYRWKNRNFRKLEKGQGSGPRELAHQLDTVGTVYSQHGAAAALSKADKLRQDHDSRIDKAHETISCIAYSLPALGLFGTMLGLSESLFVAFGGGAEGAEAVPRFVSALGTAMDTTVLGMACVVPLCGYAWFLRRLEHELAERWDTHVRCQYELDDVADGDKTTDVLRAELRQLTQAIAAEAKDSFQNMLADSADMYRKNLEDAVESVFLLQRKHDKNMVARLAAELANGLGQSVHRVGDLLEQQNGRLAENMTEHVDRLEKALQSRTPEEIHIRYQHNGHASRG